MEIYIYIADFKRSIYLGIEGQGISTLWKKQGAWGIIYALSIRLFFRMHVYACINICTHIHTCTLMLYVYITYFIFKYLQVLQL